VLKYLAFCELALLVGTQHTLTRCDELIVSGNSTHQLEG